MPANRNWVVLAGTFSLSCSAHLIAQTVPPPPACQAFSIQCPIVGGCTNPTGDSAFGPRVNPATGVQGQHWGADFAIPTGTGIVAASGGVVERSYSSATYGETVIIRHTNGSATLYAHLSARLVQEGTIGTPTTVTAGQLIGQSGSTGQSTGPHLHFEYVPNGAIIRSPSRIDPTPCVGNTVNGSIRVFDNGTAADDSFRITLDGVVLGETAIGQANTFAANNLIQGNHTLVITVLIAPDNVGTYQVDLSQGITFSDGTTSKSGSPPQGQSVQYIIVVP